jgi:hypothetical protein
MLHPEHVYHVCRHCHGRFAGHAVWGEHHLLGRPRCVLPRWFASVCVRGQRFQAPAPHR